MTDLDLQNQPEEHRHRLEKIVMSHCIQLMEHVDTVRIFVTVHDPSSDITASYNYGKGNYYAQEGQIKEWIEKQDEAAREAVRQPDDDE